MIENTLYSRKVGIEYIEYKNYKLQNLHDINQIYEDIFSKNEKSDDFKIVGKILTKKDIQNLSAEKWPLITCRPYSKRWSLCIF